MHEPGFRCFDFDKPEGERLVAILLDLLKYDDDNLRLSSCKLLFDIYQVYCKLTLYMTNVLLGRRNSL